MRRAGFGVGYGVGVIAGVLRGQVGGQGFQQRAVALGGAVLQGDGDGVKVGVRVGRRKVWSAAASAVAGCRRAGGWVP